MTVEQDINIAKQRGVTFDIAKQVTRKGKWEPVIDNLNDLGEALVLAKSIAHSVVAFEVAIYAYDPSKNYGGIIYWGSRNPDLYNDIFE